MIKRMLCQRCERPINVCYCQNITTLENQWPVYIFQYFKENKYALGTARIAKLSLNNCNIFPSNHQEYQKQLDTLFLQSPLLIFPGKDSIPLTSLSLSKPKPLIFLDGTWRKTRRLLHESPQLESFVKVSFETNRLSRYRIRKAPSLFSVSTLEAIVYVLSYLENEPTKYQSLLNSMDLMINKQIEMMGETTFKKNYRD